jgi:hypothetical protein
MIISRSIRLRMRNVSDKICSENQNTFYFPRFFFSSKVLPCTRQFVKILNGKTCNMTRHMRFVCWISKATDTHSDYGILTAFLPQQCLGECASVLRYTYIASLVIVKPGCTKIITKP